MSNFAFSFVVSTLGRTQELLALLQSLERQSLRDFEVIVVDQNQDDRLVDCLKARQWPFPVTHVRSLDRRGVCRGRNEGARLASGRILVFPDDDCWYPPWLLAKVEERFTSAKTDVVSGRAADEGGRSINGRFDAESHRIDRDNVWTTSIEWMIFIRRPVFEAVGGFDEAIGPGASTPWGANEGQDLILRAISAGFDCTFDPELFGFHAELDTSNPDAAMRQKARAYGRGMGFVMRRHGYGLASILYWLMRPAIGSLLYAGMGKTPRVLYYWNVARGRLEGWLQVA